MRGWLLAGGLWALAGTLTAALVHTTDADFLQGSGDGNVDIGAGDGDGSVRLAKLAGALGSWSSVGTIPALRQAGAWVGRDRIWVVGGSIDAAAITNTVRSLALDASGNVLSSDWHSSFPEARYDIATARWGSRLYAGLGQGTPAADKIYVTELDADGAPTGWTQAGTLPGSISEDRGGQLAADYGRLVYVAALPNGAYGSTLTYSAPLNPDGTLGAWVAEDGRDYSLTGFSLSLAMGTLISVGGEGGSWVGSTAVNRAAFSAAGALGAWAIGAALPAGRSYISGQQGAWAGKLFQTGGKSYSGGNTYFSTVYSNPLSAGGALGAWSTEASLPAVRSQHSMAGAKGGLYVIGGYVSGVTPADTVYRASFNQSTANAAQGVYVNSFDLGSDQALGQLEFDVAPAGSASLQLRSALQGGSFGGWTAASTSSPISLTWTARYVEYRVLFNDDPGQTVRLERVELVPPPTATPTPTPTPVGTSTPSEADSFKGGPFKGAEGEAIAFPNPAKGAQTLFGFTLEESGSCTLSVWTAGGTLASQVSDTFGPGKGLLKLNIKDYAPGVYLYQLEIEYLGGRKVSGPLKKFAVAP